MSRRICYCCINLLIWSVVFSVPLSCRFEREKASQELRRMTELSRSQTSRSGQLTPASLMLSGRGTPMSQHSPSK